MARRRSSRAISNDAAIRAAAIELVLQVGVDAISFRDVGRVAGLTHGALYARFEDVEELLVDLWNEVLCHRAIDLLEVVVRAVSDPNEATVRAVVDRLRDTPNADIAMVEVLLTSRRFEVLHEEVEFTSETADRVRINVQRLVEFTAKMESNSGATGRLLWSESEENLAQKLILRLQKTN